MNFLMMTNTGKYKALTREYNTQLKKDLWELIMVCQTYNGKTVEEEKTSGRSCVCQPGKTIYFQTKDVNVQFTAHFQLIFILLWFLYTYKA